MENGDDKGPREFDWFDRPKSRKLLWRLLIAACIISFLVEIPALIGHDRHAAAPIDFGRFNIPGFYAVLGFVACTLMILAAKGLGIFLKRKEDYYGEPEEETLPEDIDDDVVL